MTPVTLALLAASAAFGMGSIRTEIDRKSARVGEEFTVTFLLPSDCGYADVPLEKSDAFEVLSKDYGQGAKALTKVDVDASQSEGLSIRRGFARSGGRITYVLRALKPGFLQLAPIRVKCGAGLTETFRRELMVTGAPLAKTPEAKKPEDDLAMTPKIQQLVPNAPTELQLLDKELGALRRSTTALTDLVYNENQEIDRSLIGRLRAYYGAWLARIAAAKKIYTLEAFGISSDAAPWVAGGLFVLAALGVVAYDFWKRLAKARAKEAALPEIEINRPKLPRADETDPSKKS